MLKLIRDRLADLPWPVEPHMKKYVRPVVDAAEHRRLLTGKLVEEAIEVVTSTSESNRIEELADLLTVMHAYAHVHGITWIDVERVAERKWAERGGFERGTVWEF